MKASSPKSRDAQATPATADAPNSIKPTYAKPPCSIDVFFMYYRTAWGYCKENRARFVVQNSRFTPKFIDDQIALADTVELLPTRQSRMLMARCARMKLMAAARSVKRLAQCLKNYTEQAFKDKMLIAVQLKAAGLSDYTALKNDWDSISSMIRDGRKYLTDNAAKLSEGNDNMPASFPSNFDSAATKFQQAWDNFIARGKAMKDGTGTQDEGIDKMLAELNSMLALGKRIPEFDPLLRKKFTTRYLLNEVRGKHPAGIQGTVKLATTGKPKPGVRVSIEGDKAYVAITDEKGRYIISIPHGVYSVVFTSDDVLPLTVREKLVRPGINSRLNTSLEPKLGEA